MSQCCCLLLTAAKAEATYIEKKVSHALEMFVEGSQNIGSLDGAVWCLGELSVALEHGGGVSPAHLLQVVKTAGTPLSIPPAAKQDRV